MCGFLSFFHRELSKTAVYVAQKYNVAFGCPRIEWKTNPYLLLHDKNYWITSMDEQLATFQKNFILTSEVTWLKYFF